MQADDIPTEITKLVYTCPLSASRGYSQNEVAGMLAHYWPAIRAHILREAIANVEDPEQRALSSIGMGLGWESAREVLRRMLQDAP